MSENEETQTGNEEAIDILSQTVNVKVFGEEQEVTVEDLRDHYQKGMAAEQRLQEATRLRDENQNAIRLVEDLRRGIKEGDRDAWGRVLKGLGQSDAEVQEYFAMIDEAAAGGGKAAGAAPATFDPKMLPEEYRGAASFIQGLQRQGFTPETVAEVLSAAMKSQGATELRKYVQSALKSSKQITTILPEGADMDAVTELTEMFLDRRQRMTGQPLSREMLLGAVQDTAAALGKLPLKTPSSALESIGWLPSAGTTGHRKGTPAPDATQDPLETLVMERLAENLSDAAMRSAK